MGVSIALAETEAQWQATVIETAHLFRWRVAHFRPAMTKHGWATPVAADGKGWPDLVLCRDRIVFSELKSAKGKLTSEQKEWMTALRGAGGEFYVWTPADWDQVQEVLR